MQPLREFLQQRPFVRRIAAVADDAAQTHAAAQSKALHALGDIVRRIQAHELTRGNNVNICRIALANRHSKAAADHVAQYIIQNQILVCNNLQGLQLL